MLLISQPVRFSLFRIVLPGGKPRWKSFVFPLQPLSTSHFSCFVCFSLIFFAFDPERNLWSSPSRNSLAQFTSSNGGSRRFPQRRVSNCFVVLGDWNFVTFFLFVIWCGGKVYVKFIKVQNIKLPWILIECEVPT